MIKDIQVFKSISQDEDTKLETQYCVAFELSQIDAISEDARPDWQNKESKTSIFLMSGLEITILENFHNILNLWQAFKIQQAQACNTYKLN